MIFIVCLTVGALHLGIIVYLTSMITRHQSKDHQAASPFLSIVIAARNECENLKTLIPKLLQQEYPSFEIIIGLDRCSDDSLTYLESLKTDKIKVINIKKIPDDWNPKKYALKESINTSSGEWLAFTDGDCYPDSNRWLKFMASEIKENINFVIGVSPYEKNSSLLSHYIRFETFQTAFLYISRAVSGEPYMAVGRNMAIRKSFFEEIAGYKYIKSVTGGDDDLLIQKYATGANTRVIIGRESLMYSYPEKRWIDYLNQKNRHLSVGTKYKLKDQLFLSFSHISHLGFLILLFFNLSHIYFLPTLLFYLFIKLVSYRFVAGKMGIDINYMLFPLVDLLYALLTPVMALRSRLKKDNTWKN